MSVAMLSSTDFPLYPSTVTSVIGPATIPGWLASAASSSSMPGPGSGLKRVWSVQGSLNRLLICHTPKAAPALSL